MITENEIYLVNLFKTEIKKSKNIFLKRKQDKYYIYSYLSYHSIEENELETYEYLLNKFKLNDFSNENQTIVFEYKDFNFIIKMYHFDDSYDNDSWISIKYYIYNNNFKRFVNEFDMTYSQIETDLNKILQKQKDKINKANKKISGLEDFIGVLEFS